MMAQNKVTARTWDDHISCSILGETPNLLPHHGRSKVSCKKTSSEVESVIISLHYWLMNAKWILYNDEHFDSNESTTDDKRARTTHDKQITLPSILSTLSISRNGSKSIPTTIPPSWALKSFAQASDQPTAEHQHCMTCHHVCGGMLVLRVQCSASCWRVVLCCGEIETNNRDGSEIWVNAFICNTFIVKFAPYLPVQHLNQSPGDYVW